MIVVYSKPGCVYCVKAKDWLSSHGFEYVEADITKNPEDYNFIVDAGHKTLPQIYARDGYGALRLLVAGGFNGLESLTPAELQEKLETP